VSNIFLFLQAVLGGAASLPHKSRQEWRHSYKPTE